MRKNIRVPIRSFGSQHSRPWADMLREINEVLAVLTPEQRKTACITVDCEQQDYSDSYYAVFDLTYERPETDDEMQAREGREQKAEADREAWDRRQYEALSRKFGKPQ